MFYLIIMWMICTPPTPYNLSWLSCIMLYCSVRHVFVYNIIYNMKWVNNGYTIVFLQLFFSCLFCRSLHFPILSYFYYFSSIQMPDSLDGWMDGEWSLFETHKIIIYHLFVHGFVLLYEYNKVRSRFRSRFCI